MENNYVAAVDLGTTKVIIAVARRVERGKVEIVAIKEHASKGVIKGDLKNNEQAYASLSEVKRQIEEELEITISEVYIGISGQHIECAKATGGIFVQGSEQQVSEVKAVDVKRLVDEMYNSALPAGKSIISVLPQTYKVDDEAEILEPIGMEGKRLEAEFNIIMGEVAAIDRIKRCFKRAEMEVKGIVLQPLASSWAILSEDEKELGVAVVDIGGGTTDLCIYHDKIIRHIAVLPIGGSEVNKDIKSYGILDRHLEKLKTSFGEAIAEKAADQKFVTIPSVSGQAPKEISIRALAAIIEARMCDIIEFVAEQIEKSGYGSKLGAGIVLTGGGSTLKNIELLFRKKLAMEVRVASPSQHITEESLEKVAAPRLSTIAGILIDSLRNGKTTQIVSTKVEEEPVPVSIPVPVAEPQKFERKEEEKRESEHKPVFEQPVQPAQPAQPEVEQTQSRELSAEDAERQKRAYEAGLEAEDEPYDDEEPPVEPAEPPFGTRVKKPGIFKSIKNVFGRMFEPDEVDADDSY